MGEDDLLYAQRKGVQPTQIVVERHAAPHVVITALVGYFNKGNSGEIVEEGPPP